MTADLSDILQSARAIDPSRSYRVEVSEWLHESDAETSAPLCLLCVVPGLGIQACDIIQAKTPEEVLRRFRQMIETKNATHETENITL